MKIRENVLLSTLTTMRLGGPARYVLEIEQPGEVVQALDFANERQLPIWVMGGGANTIAHDEGFAGVVVLNRIRGIYIQVGADFVSTNDVPAEYSEPELVVKAMAGEIWDDLVATTCQLGYSGVEALSMIPGTVGAAPIQNIGAYGQDVAQVLQSVEAFDTKTAQIVTLSCDELAMTYRHTRLNQGVDSGRYIVLSVTLKLHRGSLKPPFYTSLQAYVDQHHETDFTPANIRRMVCAIRTAKLPDPTKIASAGSFFSNIYLDQAGADQAEAKGIPVWRNESGGKINSGWLIEQCDLKGKLIAGFRVSDQAALVLINESATSYQDLDHARQTIIAAVQAKFGYTLEQEPVEIPA